MKTKKSSDKKIPLGVVVISALHFLGALFLLFIGVMMLVETLRGNYHTLSLKSLIPLIILFFVGTFSLFIIGFLLLRGNKLAYLGSSMTLAAFTIGTIARIILGQLTLDRILLAVPFLIILIYFLSSKKVKKFFNYSIF